MLNKLSRTNDGPVSLCLLLFTAAVIAASRPAAAQNGVYTPKAGSPERKAIMSALRAPVEKDLKMPVIFVVDNPKIFFRVEQGWAFVGAQFRHPNGDPMGEGYYAAVGNNSDSVLALLHRIHGHWRVVTHDTGAVDEAWAEWGHRYHAPLSLFPKSS